MIVASAADSYLGSCLLVPLADRSKYGIDDEIINQLLSTGPSAASTVEEEKQSEVPKSAAVNRTHHTAAATTTVSGRSAAAAAATTTPRVIRTRR